jgi:hypothetical protein
MIASTLYAAGWSPAGGTTRWDQTVSRWVARARRVGIGLAVSGEHCYRAEAGVQLGMLAVSCGEMPGLRR